MDEEESAYEKSTNRYIQSLKDKLDVAKKDMDAFIQNVSNTVMLSAETILKKYSDTGLAMSEELTNPWDDATKAIGDFDQGEAMALMNSWTKTGGAFDNFNVNATDDLTNPWTNGETAANAFASSVQTAMANVVSSVKSNVATASGELSKLYQQIEDTDTKYNETTSKTQTPDSDQTQKETPVKKYAGSATGTIKIGSSTVVKHAQTDRQYSTTQEAIAAAKNLVYAALSEPFVQYRMKQGDTRSEATRMVASNIKWNDASAFYARGTLGTKKNQLALTDEPQYGDELTLVPTKAGNLSFMRIGTGVVPADLTKRIIEMAQMPANSMGNNIIQATVPNVAMNNTSVNLHFDSLINADYVNKDAIPELETMMDKKLNAFTKQMNYALKRV